MVQQHEPDVVVLDIILPKKTGFQVCREIKMNPATKEIQVILLSSKSQEADRFWGRRQGADAYLTKPFNPDELLEVVRAVGTRDHSLPVTNPVAGPLSAVPSDLRS